MTFIDTHTHLYSEEFDEDRNEMVARAIEAGAEYLLLPNIDANSVGPMLAMCDEWPEVCRPMMGLHPTELPENPTLLLDQMERMLSVPGNPFIAVGEVGVDLYWDASRRDEQMEVFRRQVEWSIRFDKPLVVHSRSAHDELLEVLTPFKSELKGGVFHCFGGSAKEAEDLLGFDNFFLGIGGVVTFKKSTLPAVLETTVPLDRIVIETDAPYLSPHPYRSKRNEPARLPLVLHRLAEIYGTTAENVAEVTTRNAKQLFRL